MNTQSTRTRLDFFGNLTNNQPPATQALEVKDYFAKQDSAPQGWETSSLQGPISSSSAKTLFTQVGDPASATQEYLKAVEKKTRRKMQEEKIQAEIATPYSKITTDLLKLKSNALNTSPQLSESTLRVLAFCASVNKFLLAYPCLQIIQEPNKEDDSLIGRLSEALCEARKNMHIEIIAVEQKMNELRLSNPLLSMGFLAENIFIALQSLVTNISNRNLLFISNPAIERRSSLENQHYRAPIHGKNTPAFPCSAISP